MTTIAAPSVNQCQSTLAASYTRGTDTTITLADGTLFPSPTPLGHVIYIHNADESKWCLVIYTSKATNVLTMGGGATDYALAKNVSVGDEAYEFPIGCVVELVCAADEISELFDSKMDDLVDDVTPQLGGDLDVNAKSIVSVSNNNIPITPNGTGRTIIAAPSETVTTKTAVATLTVAEAGIILVSCAATPYTITLPTAAGNTGLRYHFIKTDKNYFLITLAADGAETFNYENAAGAAQTTYPRLNTYCAEVTVVSDGTNWQCINEQLGQVPEARAYLGTQMQDLPTASPSVTIALDTENYDIGDNFDHSLYHDSTATVGTSGATLVDSAPTTPFTSDLVGCQVLNTTDATWAYIDSVDSTTQLTLNAAIMESGEDYEIYKARFVCPVAGKYQFNGQIAYQNATVNSGQYYRIQLYKNHIATLVVLFHASASWAIYPFANSVIECSKDDYLEIATDYSGGSDDANILAGTSTTFVYLRLISKS